MADEKTKVAKDLSQVLGVPVTLVPEVSTQPTAEELLKLISSLSGGKSIDVIRLQVAATEKQAADRLAGEKDKTDTLSALQPVLELAKTIKMPKGIKYALVTVTKDNTTGLFTKDVNRAVVWVNDLVSRLNDREVQIIADSVGKDKQIVDFVKTVYADCYDAALEKAKFNLESLAPITVAAAKVERKTPTYCKAEIRFDWETQEVSLESGDKRIDYYPKWTLSTGPTAATSTKTPKADSPTDGEKKESEKIDKSPGKLVWYDYLQKRLTAGDPDIKAWFDVPNSYTQSAQVYYFRLHLDKTAPGTFYNWIRKDDLTWKSVKET